MRVDVWSDVVCPWCYLGERRLERALEGFAHRDGVEVVFRSYQLDPAAASDPDDGPVPVPHDQRLAAKLGASLADVAVMDQRLTAMAAADGLEYHLADVRSADTRDAHRLLHLAAERGLQRALLERLFRAVFTEGRGVGDRAALAALAAEAGLDAAEVRAVLDGDAYADRVEADLAQARAYGITGVPFFVLDERYAVSGAQPVEVLAGALQQAWETSAAADGAPDRP